MSLHLSSADVARFRQITQTLLSPLEYPTVSEWCSDVLQQVEALLGADRSMAVFPIDGEVQAHSVSIPSHGLVQLTSIVSEMGPGRFRSGQADVDSVLRRRREKGLDVWNNELLAKASGMPLSSLPFYHEVLQPLGVTYGSGMTSALSLGEAWLSVAHSRPADDRFGIEGGMDLLRMLQPAFASGVSTVSSFGGQADALARALDSLEHAVLVVDENGRERYRSQRLRRMLHDEPEAEQVIEEMHALAEAVASYRRRPSKSAPAQAAPAGQRSVTTAVTTYDARAVLTSDESIGQGGYVLVELERDEHRLPSPSRLMECLGLTAREAEIALLLARGASNRECAQRLDISPYTVRTHVEHIFSKLGIRSRKALALRLLAADAPGY